VAGQECQAAAVPVNEVADLEVFNDPDDSIVFMVVTKMDCRAVWS
jgi:hypothetical protein